MIHFSARLHSTFANHLIDLQSYGEDRPGPQSGNIAQQLHMKTGQQESRFSVIRRLSKGGYSPIVLNASQN
ncbi:hypothetical protein TNCV_4522641 [Trichonephila clavipes]|nr:hypothetical protein TNCV_4522641 [Trichonephila clavipes]